MRSREKTKRKWGGTVSEKLGGTMKEDITFSFLKEQEMIETGET